MRKLILFSLGKFWKYREYSAGIAVNILISLTVTSLFALSFKYIIDEVALNKNDSRLFILFSAMILGCLVYLASQLFSSHLLSRVAERMKEDLRLEMFEHLQKLPPSYHDSASKGSLISRFTTDLASMQSAFLSLVPSIYAILSIALTLALTAWLHWGLSLLSFLGIFLSGVLPVHINRKAIAYSDKLKSEQTILTDYVQEHLVIHKTIRSFNLAGWELDRLRRTSASIFPLAVKAYFTSQASPISVSMALFFFNIVSLMVGVYLVTRDVMSVGMLVAYQSLYLSMSQQLKELSRHLPLLSATTASHKRIQQLLNEKPAEPAPSRNALAVQLDKMENDVALRGVSFAYSKGSPILHKVSLKIRKNEYIAIVGRNGSGKSTIVNLLMGFYNPTEGRVEFDGVDARLISLDSIRNIIGYVSQDTDLMNLSIFDNIKFGKLGARDDEVYGAARAAGIHEWIAQLPDGYQTSIGEEGRSISGGQRQRIAVARALIRNPSILLFDEVTSALDPENETLINDAIRGVAGAKTVINITHRLSSAMDADAIILMDGGRVAAVGTQEELLANNELYRMLWNKQSGFTINGDGRNAKIDVERLRKIPLFNGLDLEFSLYVSQYLVSEFIKAGEVVVERGREGDKFYIVVRGEVEVLKPKEDATEVRVAVLADGDHFGEVSLMMSLPRTATIRTLTPCTFLTIHRDRFQTILDKADPKLRWRLEQTCRERMVD